MRSDGESREIPLPPPPSLKMRSWGPRSHRITGRAAQDDPRYGRSLPWGFDTGILSVEACAFHAHPRKREREREFGG